jgi:hypothetical protein
MADYVFDPDAHLDFGQNWTDWLHAGETITIVTATVTGQLVLSSAAVVVPPGVYGDQTVAAGTTVQAWLDASAIGYGEITFEITTSQGRVDQRTDKIRIKQR